MYTYARFMYVLYPLALEFERASLRQPITMKNSCCLVKNFCIKSFGPTFEISLFILTIKIPAILSKYINNMCVISAVSGI